MTDFINDSNDLIFLTCTENNNQDLIYTT